MQRKGPAFATALMMAVLIGLGTWQIQRLHWKEGLLAAIDARSHLAPVDIATLHLTQDQDYRPATAAGVFDNRHAMFMTAISLDGDGGYHVLTPLKLDDGRSLLVDRGWIPYGSRPDKFSRPDGRVTVTGLLRAPHHAWIQPTNHPDTNDWYDIDLAAMAAFAGVDRFAPYVLDADATPNANQLPIGGQTRLELPNNHLQYALTWYGLALILIVIYIISNPKRRED